MMSSWTLALVLAPFVLLVGALGAFLIGVARSGFRRDERIEGRKTGPFLGRTLMYFVLWLIAPVERLFARWRISPHLLTATSLALSAAAALAVFRGHFALGGWLYLLTGLFDILDGRVARATGRAGAGGAYLDSVSDRFAEALFFCGLGWYYRSSPVLLLVFAALVGSFLVSYARARGESLGVADSDGGAMQRPERILYLGFGVALSPASALLLSPGPHPLHGLAVAALGLVALSSLITALRRSVRIFRALEPRAPGVSIFGRRVKEPDEKLESHSPRALKAR